MAESTVGKSRLEQTKAPALPFGPVQYDRQYQDQLNRILQLYLTQNDNVNSSLLSVGGGYYLSFPHIAASSGVTQYAGGDNVETLVAWDSADNTLGFTLNASGALAGSATAEYTGVYKIDYSLQLVNDNTASEHTAYVWLKIATAGTTTFVNVDKSASKFTLRKATSADDYLVAYSSVVFTMNAGDSVQLFWSTDKAATAGGTKGVYMEAYPAQIVGSASIPSLPSAIGSIVFVSGVTE